jgi:hypothetical protein
MEQCLQHAESAPIGQAFMLAARWKAVSTPSLSAFFSIWAVASHVVTSLILRVFSFAFALFFSMFVFASSSILKLTITITDKIKKIK